MIDTMFNNNDPFSSEKEPKKKSHFRLVLLLGGLLVLIAILFGAIIYLYLQNQNSQSLPKNTNASQAEVDTLVTKVGKHYDLPKGDTLTVATVSDVNKLKDQIFFQKAQNGDKVLIYPKTSIAILYRPSTDKIINVGPVNTQSEAATPSSSPSAAKSVKTALYNGTKTNGLTTKVEGILKTLSSIQIEVVSKTNSSNDYTESVVVDLTGKNAQAAKQMAEFSKGKVASLPQGEAKPEGADILIILGTSYVSSVTPTP
jgi:cytoskeletal protein RodZ